MPGVTIVKGDTGFREKEKGSYFLRFDNLLKLIE